MIGKEVNYHPLKQVACPWRHGSCRGRDDPDQYLSAISRYPDQVVVDRVDAVRFTLDVFLHALILPQRREGGGIL
jgi:hypothetical protein